MRVQWTHSGDFGGGWLFTVTSRSFLVRIRSSTTREITVHYQDRQLDVDGLTPYQYFSSTGVRFSVEVVARSNFGSSSLTRDAILPSE